ncbi:hypothetical protein RvY_10952 [Ramazzottius varieornatus]|uniref:Uncharacterized protein n=1 Tax=Ramazzottius varieornatus TaxID=947166 RepID=A0A1D1VIW3_RAMVA|nr:hypothetical protein RvY_10952 [Ramazzottius varieornatus]
MSKMIGPLSITLLGILFILRDSCNAQLGYSTYQNVMGQGGPTNVYGGAYSGGGFGFNPEVGVVGPPGYAGGYEILGMGQYPFVDPKTYWMLAGVNSSPKSVTANSFLWSISFALSSALYIAL